MVGFNGFFPPPVWCGGGGRIRWAPSFHLCGVDVVGFVGFLLSLLCGVEVGVDSLGSFLPPVWCRDGGIRGFIGFPLPSLGLKVVGSVSFLPSPHVV